MYLKIVFILLYIYIYLLWVIEEDKREILIIESVFFLFFGIFDLLIV